MRSTDPERSLADHITEQTEATLERFYSGLDWSPVVRSALRHAFDQLLQDAVPQPMHIEARRRAHDIVSAALSHAPIVLRNGGDSEVDHIEAHCTVEVCFCTPPPTVRSRSAHRPRASAASLALL